MVKAIWYLFWRSWWALAVKAGYGLFRLEQRGWPIPIAVINAVGALAGTRYAFRFAAMTGVYPCDVKAVPMGRKGGV